VLRAEGDAYFPEAGRDRVRSTLDLIARPARCGETCRDSPPVSPGHRCGVR
jgi:hypothetical protein